MKDQLATDVTDRFIGCLLGGAVGDALGAPIEFMTRREIIRRFGPSGVRDYVPVYGGIGRITDDTQMIDLDHFKTINDRFGHPAGDDVLRNVAELMTHAVRQTDRIARFGGEEFMLLLPDTSAADALQLANKLRQELADTPIASIGAPVTASMGLACMPAGKTLALDTLLRQTDRALYQAKHMGRNRTVVATLELETLASAHHPSTTHKTNTPAP